MKVLVHCYCSKLKNAEDEYQLMNHIGPLITNDEKSQFQDYICPLCHRIINVMINTIKEQSDA